MPTWAAVPRSCFRIGFLLFWAFENFRQNVLEQFIDAELQQKHHWGSKVTTIHKGIPKNSLEGWECQLWGSGVIGVNDAARSSPKLLALTSCFVPGKPCNSMPPELFCCCGWHSSASAQLRASRSSQRAFSTATKMISPMAISSVRATAFSPWAGYLCWDVFTAKILDPLVMLMITEWVGYETVAGGCSLPKITLPLAPEHWSVHVISVLD